MRVAKAAISGVCSAGLATTALPAASAAAALAAEDGEREVPRRDAGEDAAPAKRDAVGFARRSRQLGGSREIGARPHRVVAAEIHRLAHLRDPVGQRLAGLQDGDGQGLGHVRLQEVGRTLQTGCPIAGGFRRPFGRGIRRGRERGLDLGLVGLDRFAHDLAPVRGVHDVARPSARRAAGRFRAPGHAGRGVRHFDREPTQCTHVLEVEATRIAARRTVQRRGRRDPRMRYPLRFPHRIHRVLDQRVHGQGVVGHAVHEGCVGAVLQQASNQVGEQLLVASHRRVDAAADTAARRGGLAVQRLPHAVEALKLEVVPFVAGQDQDGRQGVGVVGCELRVEARRLRQETPGAGDVRYVRGRLAGEHRKPRQAPFLGTLYLGIPIGALDQADGDPAPRFMGQVSEPFDHVNGALLVGLHGEPEAVPSVEGGRAGGRLEDLERQVEAGPPPPRPW